MTPPRPPRARQPTVEWQVAGACNYDCSYCIQSPRFRRGRPDAEAVEHALAALGSLPGTWEIKCSGGEAFAHPLFLDRIVPGLMADTPHHISVLTNLSASRKDLQRFVHLTRGRLRVLSASLHLEHVDADTFVDKLSWVRDSVEPDVDIVVNQVVLPAALDAAETGKATVEAAGLRWFPQLYKVKRPKAERAQGGDPMTVAAYPDEARLQRLLGDQPGPRDANLAPSYRGQRCWAGVDYFVIDKDGGAWACRTSKRHGEGFLGNVYDGTLVRWSDARPCPYGMCPCTVPVNRGMVEGV
ncbi:MAG: radical SAM protein [Alphaproteobacteria bacterium]|nr:radical SAM protein [Alphaproteobacteria bacterium]